MKSLLEFLDTKSQWNKESNFSNMEFDIEIKDGLDKEYSEENIKNAIANWRNKEFINKIKKFSINLYIGKDKQIGGFIDKIFLEMNINNNFSNNPNNVPDLRCKYSMEDKHLTGFQSMTVRVFNDKLWNVGNNGEDPIIDTIKNLENYIELR